MRSTMATTGSTVPIFLPHVLGLAAYAITSSQNFLSLGLIHLDR